MYYIAQGILFYISSVYILIILYLMVQGSLEIIKYNLHVKYNGLRVANGRRISKYYHQSSMLLNFDKLDDTQLIRKANMPRFFFTNNNITVFIFLLFIIMPIVIILTILIEFAKIIFVKIDRLSDDTNIIREYVILILDYLKDIKSYKIHIREIESEIYLRQKMQILFTDKDL